MKGIVTALALTAALIVPSAPSALADGKTLVVGTNATFPPMQFVDKDKKITGYEMDLVRAVAKEAGYDITIKNAEFDGLISDVASGNCDLIAACMTITPEGRPLLRSGLLPEAGLRGAFRICHCLHG